jgi:hypothetical protein
MGPQAPITVLTNWAQLVAAVPGLAQEPPLGAALFTMNATIVEIMPGEYKLIVNPPTRAWTYDGLSATELYGHLERLSTLGLSTEGSRMDTVALTGGQRQFDPAGIGLSVTHELRNLIGQPLGNGTIWERIHKVEERDKYPLSVQFAGGQMGDFHHIKHDPKLLRLGRTTIHQLWYDTAAGQGDTPVPNSGFLITRDIAAVPGPGNQTQYTVDIVKQPASISIDGMSVAPGVGAPVRIQFNMTWNGTYYA